MLAFWYTRRYNLFDEQDVLDNEDYRLDNMFIASLVADLLKVGTLLRLFRIVIVIVIVIVIEKKRIFGIKELGQSTLNT